MNLRCSDDTTIALSPVIAVILLIAVTVGLAALAMTQFMDITSLLETTQEPRGVVSFNQGYHPGVGNESGEYYVEVQLVRVIQGDYFEVQSRNPAANYSSTLRVNPDGDSVRNELKSSGDVVVVSNLQPGDEIIIKGYLDGESNLLKQYTVRKRGG